MNSEPIQLLGDTIKAIKEDDTKKVLELLKELNETIPFWIKELEVAIQELTPNER